MQTCLLKNELSRSSSNLELLFHPVIAFIIITFAIIAICRYWRMVTYLFRNKFKSVINKFKGFT